MHRFEISRTAKTYMLLSFILWPALFGCGLLGAHCAFESDHPLLWFNVVYLAVAAGIAVFEYAVPYERDWLDPDGEIVNDIAHTLLTKGAVQVAAAIGASFPILLAMVAQPHVGTDDAFWISDWPMPLQVAAGLVIAEAGLYAAHRTAHERMILWRFHALHHSVERLRVVNTGRFHVVDSIVKAALSQIPLYLLGAPLPVFLWVGATTAFIGLLTHCNIDLRTGFLDWVFSTPRLHRWHHSRDPKVGNTNYGENLVLWDQLLGTYHNPPCPSSTDIGISGQIAESFWMQLTQPFSTEGLRQILGRHRKAMHPRRVSARTDRRDHLISRAARKSVSDNPAAAAHRSFRPSGRRSPWSRPGCREASCNRGPSAEAPSGGSASNPTPRTSIPSC